MSARTTIGSNNTIDINRSPYFDDFGTGNTTKYTQILFRPSFAVQARELNQLQSIQSEFYRKLCDFIFDEGSEIYPCDDSLYSTINVHTEYSTLYLEPNANLDYFVEGDTVYNSGETASLTVKYTLDVDDTKMVIGAISGTFTTNEELSITGKEYTCNTSPTSPATTGNITAETGTAMYYIRGSILNCSDQYYAVSYSTDTANARVGISITESIVDYDDDSTLYDNALGSPNYTAPGAHRYKKELFLDSKELNNSTTNEVTFYTTDTPDFFEYVRVINGSVSARSYQPKLNPCFVKASSAQEYDMNNAYSSDGSQLQLRRVVDGTELAAYTSANGEAILDVSTGDLYVDSSGTKVNQRHARMLYVTNGTPTVSGGQYYDGDTFLDYYSLKNRPSTNTDITACLQLGYHSEYIDSSSFISSTKYVFKTPTSSIFSKFFTNSVTPYEDAYVKYLNTAYPGSLAFPKYISSYKNSHVTYRNDRNNDILFKTVGGGLSSIISIVTNSTTTDSNPFMLSGSYLTPNNTLTLWYYPSDGTTVYESGASVPIYIQLYFSVHNYIIDSRTNKYVVLDQILSLTINTIQVGAYSLYNGVRTDLYTSEIETPISLSNISYTFPSVYNTMNPFCVSEPKEIVVNGDSSYSDGDPIVIYLKNSAASMNIPSGRIILHGARIYTKIDKHNSDGHVS